MMLYPEDKNDPRAQASSIVWPHSRAEVAQMTAFDAKAAGDFAENNMRQLGIDWVTFEGRRMPLPLHDEGRALSSDCRGHARQTRPESTSA
jgi:hypothetical protein